MPAKNSLTIEGHLGRDAEIFYCKSGTAVCNLSVGVTGKGRDGQKETTWVKVTLWKAAAEKAKDFKKGQAIRCEGKASAEAYLDRNKQPQAKLCLTAFQVELLEKKDEPAKSAANLPVNPSEPHYVDEEFNLDDLPF